MERREVRLVRVAGRIVAVQPPLNLLRKFELAGAAPTIGLDFEDDLQSPQRQLFSGRAWVAGDWNQVECHLYDGFYLVRVCGVAAVAVRADGRALRCVEAAVDTDPLWIEDAVAGPGLILALAVQGAFCLHASAVRFGEGVLAFTGLSGSGKSTLARLLDAAVSEYPVRVADDVFAAEADGDRVMALPHVLQPKVSPAAQPRLTQPERLPMAAVCVLPDPDPARPGPDGIVIERLAPAEAVVALMRHSMAAVLFSQSIRRAHLDFCAQVADAIPVYSLRYPWREDVVPDLVGRLARIASPGNLDLDGASR